MAAVVVAAAVDVDIAAEGEEASFVSAKKAQILQTFDHRKNIADWVVDVDFAERDDDRKNHGAQLLLLPVPVVAVYLADWVLGYCKKSTDEEYVAHASFDAAFEELAADFAAATGVVQLGSIAVAITSAAPIVVAAVLTDAVAVQSAAADERVFAAALEGVFAFLAAHLR